MEEKEKKPVEQNDTESEVTVTQPVAEEGSEEKGDKPTREQILEISRKENKRGDERDMQVNTRGMAMAYSVGVLVVALVNLVNVLVGRGMVVELMMAYAGMTAVWSIYYVVKTGKHKALFWVCGILCAITFLFFSAFWILKLCGVVID